MLSRISYNIKNDISWKTLSLDEINISSSLALTLVLIKNGHDRMSDRYKSSDPTSIESVHDEEASNLKLNKLTVAKLHYQTIYINTQRLTGFFLFLSVYSGRYMKIKMILICSQISVLYRLFYLG